jgi:hypothetical protein
MPPPTTAIENGLSQDFANSDGGVMVGCGRDDKEFRKRDIKV